MKKLIIYYPAWSHFEKESGFNPVGKFVSFFLKKNYSINEVFDNLKNYNFLYFIKRILSIFVVNNVISRVSPYNDRVNFINSNKIYKSLKKNSQNIALYLASEDQFCGLIVDDDIVKKQVVLFFHQPKSWFKFNSVDLKNFNDVKAIFVVSYAQYNFFVKNCNSPVYLIKHGVDLVAFNIKPLYKINPSKVLIVGQHLRNFKVVIETINKIWKIKPEVEFHFVIPVKYRPIELLQISDSDNIIFHANLSTSELVELYNTSKLTFLPLNESTANNAINESLACGTCVVTNNIGGVKDYMNSNVGIICDECDSDLFVDAILNVLEEKLIFDRSSIRKYAESHLNWKNIVRDDILRNLNLQVN